MLLKAEHVELASSLIYQRINVLKQFACLFDPWSDLGLFKTDKVDIVALLTPFKKIVIDSRQILRDLSGFHIMAIKQAAYTGMFGGRQAVTYEKSRNGIKTGIVKPIHTGAPSFRSGQNTSILHRFIRS